MTDRPLPNLVLVLGGARSGKSRLAERLADEHGPALYVATAQALDAEMVARIAHHRARRPATWRTVEAPRRVGEAVAAAWRGERAVLLEDLGLLTANLLLDAGDPDGAGFPVAVDGVEAALRADVDALLAWAEARPEVQLTLVSQEVGQGLVPPSPLGRAFRDLVGRLNQRLARRAGRAYLVVAGYALDLRRLGLPVEG